MKNYNYDIALQLDNQDKQVPKSYERKIKRQFTFLEVIEQFRLNKNNKKANK